MSKDMSGDAGPDSTRRLIIKGAVAGGLGRIGRCWQSVSLPQAQARRGIEMAKGCLRAKDRS